MNNELQIATGGEELLSSIDDGTNRLFINNTEIDSSNWVGSGTYTTTVDGHSISIVKIDSLDGNIGIKKLSEYSYQLFKYEFGIKAEDVIGLKSFIEADDINVANNIVTFTDASSRANIASGENLKTIFGKIKKFFSDLKSVAFTGSYSDLSDTPTIPTKVSELQNDSGYTTNTGTVTQVSGGTGLQGTVSSSGNISTYLPRQRTDANQGTSAATVNWIEYENNSTNTPTNAYYHIMTMGSIDSKYATQLALGMTTTAVYYRRKDNGNWTAWNRIV